MARRVARVPTPALGLALVVAWAVLAAAPLAAQRADDVGTTDPTPSPEVLDSLPDPRETFRVGIAELTGERLDGEARVVAVTFPRLLYESLADVTERDLSVDERTAYAAIRLEAATRTAATELQNAVVARDRLLFETARDDSALERRLAAADRVTRARAAYDRLVSTDPALVPAAPTRPVEYWSGHEEGRLLEAPADAEGRRALAESEDLDLLLWGTVDEIEGYLAVDLFVYHRFLETDAPAGGTIARPDDIGLDAVFVADEAAARILGRRFATLEVAVDDPGAAVAVDDRLQGFGTVRVPYLRPGAHRVLVRSEGRTPVEREVSLADGERFVLSVEVPPSTARSVRIESSPAGADVYVDSVWVGRTPLERTFAAGSSIVRLRREGYLESRFVVDGTTPATVGRALLPSSVDWSTEIRERRDGFYRALTWFVVSVPVTVLLNGGYESIRSVVFAPDAATLGLDEWQRLVRLGNIFYYSSLGGVLVNVGLFANLLVSIFNYVEVGEGSHNQ